MDYSLNNLNLNKTLSLKSYNRALKNFIKDKRWSLDLQEMKSIKNQTTHKQLISMVEHFEKKGFSVYHRIVKYGLDESQYCYEVHIL